MIGLASGAIAWLVTTLSDAIVGFALGTLLMPAFGAFLVPIDALFPEK
jgi:hypothetical protein